MSLPMQRERGFSLVEVMVAMLIGLIGTIIIFQVFAISESQKRSTTGVSDSQQNGLLALFTIEREARSAGYGLSYEPVLGCTVQAYDSNAGGRDFTFTLAAVRIADGAGGTPDSITFVYGNSNLSVSPGKLTAITNIGTAATKVESRYGFLKNDLVLLAEPAKNCVLRQISNLPGVPFLDQIEHAAGRYSKGGGTPVAYNPWDNTSQSGGRIYTLGQAPTVVTYTVAGGALLEQNLLTDTVATPIVEGIVQFQAEYGKDTDGDGDVDAWNVTTPANATEWARVIAVRMAIVARSQTPEKPNPTTFVCDTTTAAPKWINGTIPIPLTADPDWQCYRYRMFETIVPVRNAIWKPES